MTVFDRIYILPNLSIQFSNNYIFPQIIRHANIGAEVRL